MQNVPDSNTQRAYQNAVAALRASKFGVAAKVFHDILRRHPKHGPAHYQLGLIFKAQGRPETAVMHLAQAAKLLPKEYTVLMEYGVALGQVGAYAKAVNALRKAERLNPASVDVLGHSAHVFQLMGDLKKAEFYLRKAIKRKPKDGSLYRLLSIAHKFTPDDPYLKQMLAIDSADLPNPSHRWELDFAIAKALEDIKDYPSAFPYLKRGNDLVAATFPYDAAARQSQIEQLQAAQRDLLRCEPHADALNDAPIFVTGMPRSGTTLVEQIIGAHSEVTAIGEVGYLARAAEGLLQRDGQYDAVTKVAGKLRSDVAERYLADVERNFPNAQRTVDKSIQSYLYVGLVKHIMPNARFLIVRRDPRDNLLSIYRNLFRAGTHRYAYDFETLVDHFVSFQKMVQFWQDQLEGSVVIADYDALVRDPEAETRRLIASCGLGWEDACLDYHQKTGAVTTLSLAQVRQPIYKSSQQAWRRYGDAVQPLLDALENRGVDLSAWD